MKVLITSPIFSPEMRGPVTYLDQLIPRLEKAGHKITVITFTSNPNTISIPTTGGLVSRQMRLFLAILRTKPDLIYAQGADVVGFSASLVGKFARKPVIIKFVGDLFDELKRDFGKTSYVVWLATWISLHLANKIVFPAKHLRDATIKRYHLNPNKTTVIYNAIE